MQLRNPYVLFLLADWTFKTHFPTLLYHNRCNLLKQTPFTACNMHIDPKPFITACTQTLCKYPAVDGLKCQFLEAYARACYHRSKVTVKDWRSKSRCCKTVFQFLLF